MSDVEQFEAPADGRLRGFVAPRLDTYEIRRLILVAACIAFAGTANFAPSVLPQHVPVAVGSAVLGILLVLRRRPRRSAAVTNTRQGEAVELPSHVASIRRRRGSTQALQSMAASISTLERQLHEHEERLTSLSGRQSLLQVEAREKLAGLDVSLAELRDHHIELLKQLNLALAQHRQSLTDLSE